MTVEEAVKTKVKDNKEREGRTRQQKSKKKTRKQIFSNTDFRARSNKGYKSIRLFRLQQNKKNIQKYKRTKEKSNKNKKKKHRKKKEDIQKYIE